MSAKVVLVTGITGQDGAYLTAKLLKEGYIVHGMRRRSSSFNTGRIDYLLDDPSYRDRLILHYGDVVDSLSLTRLIGEIGPDEIYNLAAQSHVAVSFHTPEYTANADACGALRILESIRILGLNKTRFYQASTSELFGRVHQVPQSETTPFRPQSPYATAKLYAYWITVNYREAYGLFASNGILFNHESPLRGETFVTRKITRAVAAIAEGGSERLWLGNLDARRDWGHARDFVDGIYRIMQHKEPDDFVLATGQTNSVRRFVEVAFAEIGREVVWEGKGLHEKGRCRGSGALLVEVDPKYLRPLEVDLLVGDSSKAERLLGWKSQTNFEGLVAEMVQRDIDTIRRKRAGNSLSY